MGYKKIRRDGTVEMFIKSSEAKPTLSTDDAGTVLTIVDDATKAVLSMWCWYGTDWAEY